MNDEKIRLVVLGHNQRRFVQEFIDRVAGDSFVILKNIYDNEDYDDFIKVSSGYAYIESVINRNWVKLPYRTNGDKIETILNQAWVEINENNFFSILSSFLLANHHDVCAPD